MIRGYHILCALISLFIFSGIGESRAQPMEYVRVCDAYGPGWFYIPGTEKCLKPTTGEIRYENEFGEQFDESALAQRMSAVEDQVAISNALQAPDLIQGETFGLKFNWGTSGDSNALGITGAMVLVPNTGSGRVAISGGAAFTGREIGGTAGLQFSW